MKYYSELLKKTFDTAEDCEKAEAEENTRLAEVEKKETALANEKKQYAAAIEEAENGLNAAYDELAQAKKRAAELREDYRKNVRELQKKLEEDIATVLTPAQTEVDKAEQKKLKALQEFTEKYGAYKKVYTGNKALEEYHRMHRTIDSIFNNLFWF